MSGREATRYPEELLRFVARFDRREFWLAHEELEELWQRDRCDFFKGMIQLAAAYLHIERHNWRGAGRLLRTGLGYMEEAPGAHQGFDVEGVRARARAALQRVEALSAGELSAFDESLFFELGPLFEGTVADDVVQDEPLPYRVRRYEDGYRPVRRNGEG